MLDPAHERFQWAALADRFNGDIARLALLTDAQIHGILCHERDKDGVLVPPPKPKPAGLAAKMAKLIGIARLRWARIISAEQAEELVKQVEADGEATGTAAG